MSASTLIASIVLTLVAAGLYAGVGVRYWQRARAGGDANLRHFALFWIALALWGAVEASWSLWVAIVPPPLAVSVLLLHVKVPLAVLSFYGLVHYLTSLYSTDPRALRLVTGAYLLVFAFVDGFYWWRHPTGQVVETWSAQLVYLRDSPAIYTAVAVVLFVPPLVSAIAYALRFRHATDPAQRRRILVVSVFFAVFFGGVLLGWLSAWPWWGLVEKTLALATVAAVYLAIEPAPDGQVLRGEIAPV